MELKLKKYTVPNEYPEIYRHNFEQISRLDEYPEFCRLVELLSKATKIDKRIIMLELKRYLMNQAEYHGVAKSVAGMAAQKSLTSFLSRLKKYLFGNKKQGGKKAEVMVDEWSNGVLDNFYGSKLLSSIGNGYRMMTFNFSAGYPIKKKFYLKYLIWILSAQYQSRQLTKQVGIELKPFIHILFARFLFGLSIKSDIGPKVIISGNDNGFPVIMGKATGAEIVLIQNAKKTLFSDATFKYADHYCAMGDMGLNGVLGNTGCEFRNIYCLGSLRLYNSLTAMTELAEKSDILWISDLEIQPEDEYTFRHYYPNKYEIQAIKLLNQHASQSGRKIIYKCRFEGEYDELKRLGLICPNIKYIGRNELNTYHLVYSSRAVLSTLSSVVYEAMSIGKRGGYINLSGNSNLNYDARKLEIEYSPSSKGTFSEFVEKLLNSNTDQPQNRGPESDYLREFMRILDVIVKK